MILISRRRWIMGGTRYHARGSDEKGNVANCIEKEMIVFRHQIIDKSKLEESQKDKTPHSISTIYSYCQLGGSVPAFWQ